MNNTLSSVVFSSTVFKEILSLINRRVGFSLTLKSLPAQALVLSVLLEKTKKRIGLVCDSEKIALSLFKDCFSFLEKKAHHFPLFSKDTTSVPGFVSQSRVLFTRSFNAIVEKELGLYLASKETINTTVSPTKKNKEDSLFFNLGDLTSKEDIVKKLASWGYEHVDHTFTPNTFSARGGILDIFPVYANHPIRIEFFGNQVESLRIFNTETQLSEGSRDSFKLLAPPLKKNKSSQKLVETINSQCDVVLYVSSSGFSFLNGETPKNIHVDTLRLSGLSSEELQKTVDCFLKQKNKTTTFLFNPASRAFYRSEDMVEIDDILSGSFNIPTLGLSCFVAPGKGQKKAPKTRKESPGARQRKISSLEELRWGDPLVHQDYGLGIYRGLETIGDKNNQEENIRIEYANGGSIYVPINRFGRVHKYIGLGGAFPKLSHLGSGVWDKQKLATKKNAREVVDSLVALYQSRSTPRGFNYVQDKELTQKLEESFPFQETEDQLAAIKQINFDMDKKTPMDRLVYGDVGFGKTEVALRAALRAVISGKVVFFLSPTTVLSDQHYITCKNRLGELGVSVELMSRFRTKKEQSIIIESLHKNRIDVLVGTHRLLGEDVPTENLGLLIIDEEHRFGVKHKEKIRRFKNRVDILTLTATPIPRTLQQSLVGIRDTSKIETPPRERLPIQTHVKRFEWPFVVEALQKELNRGGQSYFLHNEVSNLPFYLEKLQVFFPNATIAVGHGQMSSRDLEKTIIGFFEGKIDILLCTTIIESGLDVPNANTIIINNAQMFGLAQLYQIRGRVGRAEEQAFCFLCIPKKLKLLPEAYQRLKAIEHHSALGSGYFIAMKDLEIRGAGNLFGYEQSGQISKVGLELYNKILTQAVKEKEGGSLDEKKEKLTLVFKGAAQIPSDYMPLIQDRLYFYQKISRVTSLENLSEVSAELRDRFGPLPSETETLFNLSQIQCSLYLFPLSKCNINGASLSFVLDAVPDEVNPKVFFDSLQRVLKEETRPFKMETIKTGSLLVSFETTSLEDSFSLALLFHELFSRVLSL